MPGASQRARRGAGQALADRAYFLTIRHLSWRNNLPKHIISRVQMRTVFMAIDSSIYKLFDY
jgi:hypothetical protein